LRVGLMSLETPSDDQVLAWCWSISAIAGTVA